MDFLRCIKWKLHLTKKITATKNKAKVSPTKELSMVCSRYLLSLKEKNHLFLFLRTHIFIYFNQFFALNKNINVMVFIKTTLQNNRALVKKNYICIFY
jgi:hypothetical protein